MTAADKDERVCSVRSGTVVGIAALYVADSNESVESTEDKAAFLVSIARPGDKVSTS